MFLLKNEKVVKLILSPLILLYVFLIQLFVGLHLSHKNRLHTVKKKKKSKGLLRTSLRLFPKVIFQSAGIEADKVQLSLLFLFVA